MFTKLLCCQGRPTYPILLGILYPWFLSMWSMGAFDRKDGRKQAGTTTTIRYHHGSYEENNIIHEYPLSSSVGAVAPTSTQVFEEVIRWKEIDIEYPTEKARQVAIKTGHFVPNNNLPLGIHAFKHRIFITLPKWKNGVPVTLGVVDKNDGPSPTIKPYPDWSWHLNNDCGAGLTSVFRIDVDTCNRLWVLDSGVVDAENTVNQLCPPQIVIFDLETDKLVRRYAVPRDQSPESSLLSNIVVEILHNVKDCLDAYAYIGDVFRYGLIVYSYRTNRSWRVTHSYFYPDPLASDYVLDGIEFQWVDGLFGMALSPPDIEGKTLLYFHPLSSYREFSVPTHIIRNESLGFAMNKFFKTVGQPRGVSLWQSTGSAIDRDGVLFYNLLSKSAVACWNSFSQNYHPSTQHILYQNNQTLSFPNDLRVDNEQEQSIWILSNRLHKFLYDRLDPNDVNFRILTAPVRRLVDGTICSLNT